MFLAFVLTTAVAHRQQAETWTYESRNQTTRPDSNRIVHLARPLAPADGDCRSNIFLHSRRQRDGRRARTQGRRSAQAVLVATGDHNSPHRTTTFSKTRQECVAGFCTTKHTESLTLQFSLAFSFHWRRVLALYVFSLVQPCVNSFVPHTKTWFVSRQVREFPLRLGTREKSLILRRCSSCRSLRTKLSQPSSGA